jgi:hypothetical protein
MPTLYQLFVSSTKQAPSDAGYFPDGERTRTIF